MRKLFLATMVCGWAFSAFASIVGAFKFCRCSIAQRAVQPLAIIKDFDVLKGTGGTAYRLQRATSVTGPWISSS